MRAGLLGLGEEVTVPGEDAKVYVISVAAELAGMHPQTLRQYDRLGLVTPSRASGRGRRYSLRDIATLREVQRLSQDEGVNLAGIKRILELELEIDGLRRRSSTCARSSTPVVASSPPTRPATSP